ncbi:I78 family peptidase inhibitor [Paracoccus sediminicola]|uniref:I78 family peptidase inhibitor n=1 Tax=Paracoccus sediminicola TaxID=3017783 RepID=UPI0022F0FDC4|nr:I78 family peptidase inhibitor [Paracoccus sediminicola]WBU57237.1 I78 family peptidase inhibitor [Paracoccus sediminicola]
MKTPRLFAPLAAALALAGCMAAPPQAPVDQAVVNPQVAPLPTASDDGLVERKPDLCKASTYTSYIGQPGSVVPTLGITREYRVVEYRGIEPQEYDPNRIVFRLDSAGNISAVDCG